MPAAITDTIDTVVHAMLTRSRKKIVWAQIKAHVLYAWASANNRVEFEDGGYELTNPLIVGRNPNVASYQYYDELPITQTNEFNTVKYYFTRVAGSLMISDQEMDENSGEGKIFDIAAKKMDVLEESVKEKFSTYMYGAGVGRDPNGLALLIPTDPTTGTVGNINQATNLYWRTSSYAFAGTLTSGNIEQAYDDLMLDLRVKDDTPDIILSGRNLFRMYKQAVRDKFTIPLNEGSANSKKLYDLGFQGVEHSGVPIVYDEDCDINTAYFINSKYLKLHIFRGVNWKVKNLVAPWNQDVIGKRMVWQGNWARWKSWRTHAVVTN